METDTFKGADSSRPKVSYVVIAYNESVVIQSSIRSILAQDGAPEDEVVVVDDGSSDETAELVSRVAGSHPSVRLIRLTHNRGRGFARRTGIEQARGEFIATVDADIILPPDWLAQSLAHLVERDAVGGTAVPDGDIAYICSRFRLTPRLRSHSTEVTGSNALYRRPVFDLVSFDPALREGEDVAFNHAMRSHGVRLATVPGLVVRHAESKNFIESVRWLQQSGRGAARQLRRYKEVRLPDIVFLGWLLCVLSVLMRPCRRRCAVPVAYAFAASVVHVARACIWEARSTHRILGAIVVDTVLLKAYFTGRIVGLIRAEKPSVDDPSPAAP